jgi:hypothetical protein
MKLLCDYRIFLVFISLCDMFIYIPSAPVVYFLWSPKNRCINETWDILLWKWELDGCHTGFYSFVKYRSPEFSSKVRIILDVVFELLLWYEIHMFKSKISWNTSIPFLKWWIDFQCHHLNYSGGEWFRLTGIETLKNYFISISSGSVTPYMSKPSPTSMLFFLKFIFHTYSSYPLSAEECSCIYFCNTLL